MEKIKISVVIPVYQAEGCIKELCARLNHTLGKIDQNYEIILVEDCGNDNSWCLLAEIAKSDHRVKAIKLSRNFGQHKALTAGLDRASGEWVVTMDCDLQDRPEEIAKLYEKAKQGFDVVLARRGKRSDSTFKRFSNRAFYLIFNYLTDMKYDPEVGGFKIMSQKVVRSISGMREQVRFINGFVDWAGFSTAYVDVVHSERYAGETSYTFIKLLRFAQDIILSYSDKPLKILVKIGFFIAGFAFIFGVGLLFNTLFFGSNVSGWTSLIVSLYFLCGIIIANIGVVGLYVGKIYEETKGRPIYIIDQCVGYDDDVGSESIDEQEVKIHEK